MDTYMIQIEHLTKDFKVLNHKRTWRICHGTHSPHLLLETYRHSS